MMFVHVKVMNFLFVSTYFLFYVKVYSIFDVIEYQLTVFQCFPRLGAVISTIKTALVYMKNISLNSLSAITPLN